MSDAVFFVVFRRGRDPSHPPSHGPTVARVRKSRPKFDNLPVADLPDFSYLAQDMRISVPKSPPRPRAGCSGEYGAETHRKTEPIHYFF